MTPPGRRHTDVSRGTSTRVSVRRRGQRSAPSGTLPSGAPFPVPWLSPEKRLSTKEIPSAHLHSPPGFFQEATRGGIRFRLARLRRVFMILVFMVLFTHRVVGKEPLLRQDGFRCRLLMGPRPTESIEQRITVRDVVDPTFGPRLTPQQTQDSKREAPQEAEPSDGNLHVLGTGRKVLAPTGKEG